MRLSPDTAGRLPSDISRFSYERDHQQGGIVHFGIGAFHRAHQAWYTDLAMDTGDKDWAITGVSLRSPSVAAQMNPQQGLFTVTERSAKGSRTRLMGAVREVLVAGTGSAALSSLLAAGETRIVSFTVTEKGYCRAPNGSLDLDLAAQGSFYPVLAEAMDVRRESGVQGFTLLSCDNLAQNGQQLHRLMSEYLTARAKHLLPWFEAECRCPSSMVDRIVPATTAEDRSALAAQLGMDDEAAVFTEAFTQWVIEDDFAAGRPAWDRVGAQLVADVEPYETAKLRMLNGSHSALAYLGLERGHVFVHQAIADAEVRTLVERLMREEAAPTVSAGPEQDLERYASSLMERFANPALNHRLEQIAMDGSQKIPQRWLDTLAEQARRGRSCPAILTALAAWLRHVRQHQRSADDPLVPELRRLWQQYGSRDIAQRVFGSGGLLASAWQPSQEDLAFLMTDLSRP
ncbi:mannitol dehydrogenase family protein [Novosphingobium sp. M1R2S20]|uniref:Mannitol dehydrogenase family protein n=1 Tax=Novosphingobium rhizovicinum TaxID=3228928 RepID=A0ABV3RFT5_9SPHN